MPSDYHRATALNALGDDVALLRELIGVFLADVPQRVALLEAAAAAGDLPEVMHQAHALKGECGTLAATLTVSHMRELEMAARNGDGAAVAEVRVEAISALADLLADLKVEYGVL